MSERNAVYKCLKCGNVVEVLHAGTCDPSCCGATMLRMSENTVDASKEKHVPVLEKIAEGWRVSVGAIAHPMEEAHFIEWIELQADGVVYKAFLKPGDQPVVVFPVQSPQASAREFCNLHGLWKASN